MTRNTDQSLIDQIGDHHWYQSIPLGDGTTTPGETGEAEQRKLEMIGLPEDLSGKSVLDVGCNEGFYSFEAERRGAARVLAIDKSSAAGEKLNLIKKIYNSKVEFRPVDLFELNIEELGRFDLVFFLAVFHHLRYPFQAVDRIYQLTGECAVMEFVEAVPAGSEEQAALVRKYSKKGHLHLLPTRAFLHDILKQAGFSSVEILGTHRAHKVNPARKMPDHTERRVLLKAFR